MYTHGQEVNSATKNYDPVNETETFILYVGASVHSFKEEA